MQLTIENCNNIKSGIINIKENSLNIKYAINGTGKSSIAKIIEAKALNNEEYIKKLMPYGSEQIPSISGLNEGSKVTIFNENYINRYLFQKDYIIPNAFSIFVKTPDYEQRMQNIHNMLSDVRKNFEQNDDLNNLISILYFFLDGYGKAKGLAKTGPLYKGLGEGNKICHIPEDIKEYAPYLQNNAGASNVKWLKWMSDGKPFVEVVDQCPFCSHPGTTKTKTDRIYHFFDPKKIEHLNKILEIFEKIQPYFSVEIQQKIHDIAENANGISKADIAFLESLKNKVASLYNSLVKVKKFDFFSLKDVDRMAQFLQQSKIDLGQYPELSSETMESEIAKINESIIKVEENVIQLQKEIRDQKYAITLTIKKHQDKINGFLTCAGYNYEVFIDIKDNENANLMLKPKNINNTQYVEDVKDHLSYGEKNAFALILFVYSATYEGSDLIVFDDPISSFDGNKRFAILDMLFLDRKNPLRNKSVLFLSHDFSIVVDIIRSLAVKFGNTVHPQAHFLTNHKGCLKEKEIKYDDIRTFCSVMKENAKKNINIVNRVIYLRRFYEVNDEKGAVWDVLSNAIHKRNRSEAYQVNSLGERESISEEIFNSAVEEIKKYIEGFDYNTFISIVNDDNQMKSIYRESNSNYERLQIYRIIKGENASAQNNVIQKFVNETFHVDYNYIYQLDPREYETVPQYIVDICDKEILGE